MRVAVVIVAVVVIAVLGARLSDHNACEDARSAVFAVVTGKAPRAELEGQLAELEDHCQGSEALVAAAGALRTIGARAQALELARDATEREPDSFSAWRARAVLATGAEARDATARARELNPRWQA